MVYIYLFMKNGKFLFDKYVYKLIVSLIMALGDTLLGGIQSQFNKTMNTTKNLVKNDSKALYTTYEGQDWNSDAIHTDAQKRFSTKSPIPNYPKVGNLTYVYYSINPDVASMIQKKHNKIRGWTNVLENYYKNLPTPTNVTFSSNLSVGQPTNSQQSASGVKKENAVTSALRNVVGSGLNTVQNVGNEIIDGARGVLNDINKGFNSLFIDPFKSTFKKMTADLKNTWGIGDIMDTASAAANAVDYIETPEDLRTLSKELSKFTKSVDRPKIKLNTITLNQYNRKRVVYKNAEFPSIKVSFYDVKNSPIQRFFFSYLKIINDSFLLKSKSSFTMNTMYDNDYAKYFEEWGFNTDSDFALIDRITVIEWLSDKMTAYNYNKPKITNIEMSSSTLGDWNPQEVSVTFEYEGLTTDVYDIPELSKLQKNKDIAGYQKYFIGKDIVKDTAELVQMNFKGSSSYFTDLATSFIQGVLNRSNGESKWDTIKRQGIETARKLGYAEEIDYYNTLVNDLQNYKNGGAKVIYNTLYSPASAVGIVVNSDTNQMGQLPINS